MATRLGLWLIVLGAFLGLVGCQEVQTVGGAPREIAYTRIVSLSPSTSEILSNLQATPRLIGRTSECNFPIAIQNVPIVMTGTTPDFERLARANPDMVVYDASLFSDDVIAQIEALGVATRGMDVSNITELMDFIVRLSSELGTEEQAERISNELLRARARAGDTIETQRRAAVLLVDDGGGEYMIAGTGTFVADVVRSAGAEFIGPEAPNFVTANVESLIGYNPQVIFTAGNGQRVLNDPRLQNVSAVRNNRVFEVEGDLLLRSGSRVHTLITDMGALLARTED